MGRICKYNLGKDDEGKRVKSETFTPSNGYPSASTTTTITNTTNINCSLWGNDFDGSKDIDGSMVINGDVIIGFDDDDYDPDDYIDEDEDGNEIQLELPKGDLTVQGTITCNTKVLSKDVEADTVYAKEHMYVTNPADSQKTDIIDLLKDYNDRITTNANNIAINKSNISTNTSNIANNKARIDALENKVNNLEGCDCDGSNSGSNNGYVPSEPTTIDGRVRWNKMSLNDNNMSGFIFQNDEGIVEFSPTELADSYDSQDSGLPIPRANYCTDIQCRWEYTKDDNDSLGRMIPTFKGVGYTQQIGYFNTYQYITLDTITAEVISKTDKNYNCNITSVEYTIYCDGNAVAEGNGSAATHRVSQSGMYSIRISVNGTHNKPIINLSDNDECICRIYANYNMPPANTLGQITPTGIAYAFAYCNGLAYIGSDCTIFKYGNYGLKIDPSGIYRFNGDDWVRTTL